MVSNRNHRASRPARPGKPIAPRDRNWWARPQLELLEERLAPASLNYLAVTDGALSLRVASNQLQLVDADNPLTVLAADSLANVTRVTIDANGRDVQLTIDVSVPSLSEGVTFVGGSGNSTLIGPARDNDWTVTATGAGTLNDFVRFTGVEKLVGSSQNDTFRLGNAPLGSLTIEAGGGSDALDNRLSTANNIWNVTGSGAGNLDGSLQFTGIDKLVGGSGSDTYRFANAHLGSLTIDEAAGGTNLLDFTTSTPALSVSITLQDGSASTTLMGPDSDSIWTFNSLAVGNLNGTIAFTGLTRFKGGSKADTYRFVANTPLGSLSLDETAGGIDTLDFSATTFAVSVDLSKPGPQTVNANLNLTLASGHTFENVIGGSGNDQLTGNELNNALTGGPGNDTLDGGPGDDTYVFTPAWGIDTIKERPGATLGAGLDTFDFFSITANLTVTMSHYAAFTLTAGTDSIQAEEIERLIGGSGSNTLDYSSYTSRVVVDLSRNQATGLAFVSGFANVTGSTFNDTLIGDAGANVLRGGAGDDRISGGAGNDILDGGTGTNTLFEQRDADFLLTDFSLTISVTSATESDTLFNIQRAELTGGAGSNTLNAQAFTGNVVLDGGSTIELSLLNDSVGVRTTDLETLSLLGKEGDTLLSSLNQGDGIRFVPGVDFRIFLTDGLTVDVDVGPSPTLQGALAAIVQASNGRFSASLDEASGDAIVLKDSLDRGGNLRVEALNGSFAAADLGILRIGYRSVLVGTPISTVRADVRVRTSSGRVIDIDLSPARTVADLIDFFAIYDLTLSINATGTGLILRDHDGGTGDIQVLNLNGSNAATDLGLLGTGTGPVRNGASLVAGAVKLDGRGANDVLLGGAGDDMLIIGGGNATLHGGGGTNTLVVTRDTDFTLSNTSLTVGSSEVSSLANIQRATLTGGPSDNRIDAAAFSLGSVTLIGGAGDDVLIGGAGDDFLSGGRGIDSLHGGAGTNTVFERGSGRFILTDSSLDLGEGTHHVVTVQLTGTVTAGTFRLSFDGQSTRPIPFDADAFLVKSRLTALPGIGDNDITVTRLRETDPWTITFRGIAGGMSQPTLTATSIDLVGGGVTASITVQGVKRVNLLAGIQRAELIGGDGGNLMDASVFSGPVVLVGGAGDDRLIGGIGDDVLWGGAGDDRLTGGPGMDVLHGGDGLDTLVESRDVDFTLTNITLTVSGGEVNTISGFERADLTGGASNNVIDARAFSGLSASTELRLLHSGQGVRTTAGVSVDMSALAGTMALSLFNNGTGVRTVTGNDLRITLTDGRQFNVDLGNVTTLQDVFDAITKVAEAEAPGRLGLGFNSAGTGLILRDNQAAGGNLTVTALNDSPAAADLGILGTGNGATLEGAPLTDASSDLRITLTDGTRVQVDLTGLLRIQDVLDALTAAHPKLSALFNTELSAIVLFDSAGGDGQLQVADINGSNAAADLGILGTAPPGISRSTLIGSALGIGSVNLDGGAGNDTLYGSPGDDFLTGGTGSNTLVGSGGIDTVVESRNANFTLTNTSLTIDSDTTTLTGISRADLAGGAGANTLDASAFTLGPVILRTGGGLDTLKGGPAGTQYFIDVTGLTRPASQNDTSRQITVFQGVGDRVLLQGADSTLTQADLYWVHFANSAAVDTVIRGDEVSISEDLFFPGKNLTIEGNRITLSGRTLSTSNPFGTAGEIKLQANHIVIGAGAQLLAEGPTPGQHGSISLLAIDDHAGFQGFSFANVDLTDTSVTVGAATIKGGTVQIVATSNSQKILRESDFGENPVAQFFGGTVLGGIVQAIEGIAVAAGVAVSRASARIDVGTDSNSPTIITAENFSAVSTVKTMTQVIPLGSFNDVGLADGPWKVEVNWGDGTGVSFFTDSQGDLGALAHRYLESRSAPYTVTVKVTDKDGHAGLTTFQVTVLDVSPTISLFGTPTVNRGNVFRLRVGLPVDPGQDTVRRIRINWGDGRSNEYTASQMAQAKRQFAHRYARGGAYTITIDALDQDGWHLGVGSRILNVLDARIVAPATAGPRKPFTFRGLSNVPVDVEAGLRYSWTLFDPAGRPLKSVTPTAANPRPAITFVPNRAGIYTVRLTIRDSGGGITVISRQIRIVGR